MIPKTHHSVGGKEIVPIEQQIETVVEEALVLECSTEHLAPVRHLTTNNDSDPLPVEITWMWESNFGIQRKTL